MSKHFAPLFKQKFTDTRKQRGEILRHLEKGPTTISELKEKIPLPKNVILWNLIGLIRWGQVEIVSERDDELVYAITGIK